MTSAESLAVAKKLIAPVRGGGFLMEQPHMMQERRSIKATPAEKPYEVAKRKRTLQKVLWGLTSAVINVQGPRH